MVKVSVIPTAPGSAARPWNRKPGQAWPLAYVHLHIRKDNDNNLVVVRQMELEFLQPSVREEFELVFRLRQLIDQALDRANLYLGVVSKANLLLQSVDDSLRARALSAVVDS